MPQVDFLGVLFIVWGLLTTLVGVSTLALGVGAFALIASAGRGGASSQVAASLTAGLFTALAVVAILWGAAHIIVGVPLRRHRPWARIIALMLGSVDLLLLPYGTALGTYALWLLLGEQGRNLFTNPNPESLIPNPCPTAHPQSRLSSTVRSARHVAKRANRRGRFRRAR